MAYGSDEYVRHPACLQRVRKYQGVDLEYDDEASNRDFYTKQEKDKPFKNAYLVVNRDELVDWNRQNSNSITSEGTRESKHIHILFLNERNTARYKLMKTSLSMKLKNVFHDFAEAENISLRSFRFSYEGRPLFLSSVGKKTPTDLGMENNANIIVTDLTEINSENVAPTKISSTRTNRKKKGNKDRGKQKMGSHPKKQPLVIEKTAEEFRIEHSKILSKLHEEAQPQLKLIRQRLNSLLIERKPPKVKSSPRSNNEPRHPQTIDKSSFDDLGGKAGKSHYIVQVGEVTSLYKRASVVRQVIVNKSFSSLIFMDLQGRKRWMPSTKACPDGMILLCLDLTPLSFLLRLFVGVGANYLVKWLSDGLSVLIKWPMLLKVGKRDLTVQQL